VVEQRKERHIMEGRKQLKNEVRRGMWKEGSK
jgi:hypothetical protein